MIRTYPVYYYKNWRKLGLFYIIVLTVMPLVFILLSRLLLSRAGYSEAIIDNKLKGITLPFLISYIIIYILFIIYITRKKNDQIVIQDNIISIENKKISAKNCLISYGKSGVPGATGATGTICYLDDGVNTIKICTTELDDQEYKYTREWSSGQDVYVMAENIYIKFIEYITTQLHCKEENVITCMPTTQGIVVELLRGKYKNLPYYLFTIVGVSFVLIFFELLLKLEDPSALLHLIGIVGAILLVRYKKRKFKNYYIEINNNIFNLKEKKSGKEVFSTSVNLITSDIFFIHYRAKSSEFTYTILVLHIPQFATLRIATMGKQAVFNPIRKWKWFGGFYTYHYVIDYKSWIKLTKAIRGTSFNIN